MRVFPDDPEYRRLARLEAEYWADPPFTTAHIDANRSETLERFTNRSYTGNPDVSWLDDLIARGPFGTAAMLGTTEGAYECDWLRRRASRHLDIYDLSEGSLRRARGRLISRRFGIPWPARRVRFTQADLNFVDLPADRYDVIWTSGSLHHVVNLEHLLAEVEKSLRPRGIFAIHDYVGEPLLQYAPERLERINRAYHAVPGRFHRAGIETVALPHLDQISPFEAVRPTDILPLARQRFEVLHLALTEALFPLFMLIDFAAIEREAPDLLRPIFAAEEEAQRDPSVSRCSAYAVLRKR